MKLRHTVPSALLLLASPARMSIKKTTIVASLLLLGSGAHASIATSGYINTIITLSQGVVLFSQDGNRSTVASCGASQPARWAIDDTTPAGQAQVAQLLTAYSLHKPVLVFGYDGCAVWPNTETAQLIQTQDP